MEEVVITLGAGLGASMVRSFVGWLENAMEDSKITAYELGQLGATIARLLVLTLGAKYALNLEPLAAAGSAIIADFIIMAIKKIRRK